MKKILHITFPEAFGLKATKRFVYDETPGQAEAERLTGMEVNREAEINANAEGEAGITKTFDKAKADIDSKAGEFKTKYEGKEDADKAKAAIEAARVAAQAKLEKAKSDAIGKLKLNADKDSNDLAKVLVDKRKSDADKKYNSPLGYQSVPGDAGFDWKADGKKSEWNHLGTEDFKVSLTAMIKAVYVAEGPKAADDLVAKMKSMKLGFMEMKYDDEFKFAQGVEHNPPLIRFNPDMDNDENGNTRKLTGLVFGYAHAARNRIQDDAAREAYLSYLSESGKKAGSAPRSMSPDDIKTPDEWIALPGNEKYLGTGKKIDEQKLNEERTARVNDLVSNLPNERTWEREQLKGVLLGRLQGEKDPKKWDDIIADTTAKAYGISRADYDATSWKDLNKDKVKNINDFVKKSQESMGKYVLDDGQNHDGKGRGYVVGLLIKAEEKFKDDPVMLAKYKEQLKTITASEDLRQKMGDNLANSEYFSKRQGESNSYQQRREIDNKMGAANDALFEVVKKELPSPDKFADTLTAEKDAKYNSMSEKYRNQERYADDMIAKIPADKIKERNYIRSILIAAVGKETDPKKIRDLGEAALKDAKGLNLDPANLGSVEYEKNIQAFVNAHKDFTDNGNKMDDQSKGLAAGLLYAAEVKFKDDPNKDKIIAGYKEYLKGKMDKLGSDSDTQEKVEALKRKQSLLEETSDPETKKKILASIDKLQTSLYNKSWDTMAWPDTYKKDFEEGEGKKREELMAGNKEFLDKYGTKEKTENYAKANPQIDEIFKTIPKEKYDANKDKIEAKKKELHALMLSKDIKTPEGRLGVLAQAQDYVGRLLDDKAGERRFKESADRYTVTNKILAASGDKKKSGDYVTDMAKGLGYETGKDKLDPKVKAALDEVDKAKDEDRANVMAVQLAALFKDSSQGQNPNFTTFTKSDFDDYSKYIAEKPKEEPKKKTSVGGGAPSGGAPGGGSPSGVPSGSPGGSPKAAPGGPKTKPGEKEKKKETIDGDKLLSLLKTAITTVLAKYKGGEIVKDIPSTVAEIQGALMASLNGILDQYDRSKISKISYIDPDSGVGFSAGPTDAAFDISGINAAWVEKNMKGKEKIKDAAEAKKKMNAIITSVLSGYEKMSPADFVKKFKDADNFNYGVLSSLNAQITQLISTVDPSVKNVVSDTISGYSINLDPGASSVEGSHAWAQRVFKQKNIDAGLGEDKPKLDAISSAVNKGYSTLSQNVGNGTIKTVAQFNSAVNSLIAGIASKYQLKDGSYDVWFQASGFKINYKDGKFTGVSGDYAGLASSVRMDNPDAPRLA